MTFSLEGEVIKIKNAVESKIQGSANYGMVATIFTFFQGRATTFGILFAVEGVVLLSIGIWGFLHGRDLSSLASFALAMAALNGSIQAIIFAHSCKEDWATLKQQQVDKSTCNPAAITATAQVTQ